MLKKLRQVDLESAPAILTVLACYVALGMWFSWYERDLRRDYVGIGLYYGSKYTINGLKQVSAGVITREQFNTRMQEFIDSLRTEVNVERLDLSF